MALKNISAMVLVMAAGLMLSAVPDPDPAMQPVLTTRNAPAFCANGFNDLYKVLRMNLKSPQPPFATHNAVPGPHFKREVYLWDTAFIAQVWKWWDAPLAQEIFLPLFAIQKPSGMIPHSSEQTHDSQPPVLSWSIWDIFQLTHDRAFLEQAYPHLRDFNRWWHEKRRMSNGLFFWDNRFESGWDNSPRFTNRDASKIIKMKSIAQVDLCSYLVVDDLTLAKMADELGKPEDAAAFRKNAEDLKKLVNKYLWSEPDGLYYDFNFDRNQFVRINTDAAFLPMFANIPDPARAQKLLGHIMDPAEYNTLIPLPTVAANDPNFFLDMWRGPVWINIDYMIVLGMKNYGFDAEASLIAFKIAKALFEMREKTGHFHEFYDPHKLSLDDLHRKTDLGSILFKKNDKPVPDFVGWTGLVDNLVIEVLMGVGKTGDKWTLAPVVPPQMAGMKLTLDLPSQATRISLDLKAPDRIPAEVVANQKIKSLDLGGGKSASW